VHRPAHHQFMKLLDGCISRSHLRHHLAVLHDVHPVAERQQFVEPVRDENHRAAIVAQLAHYGEQQFHFALVEHPVRTQAALAQAINADKSRIIGVLDDLQQRGLIRRQADQADRRVHLLSLTPEGDRLRMSVEAAIRRGEEEVLAVLPPADRDVFLRSLKTLYERHRTP